MMTTASRDDRARPGLGASERATRWIYTGLWRVLVDWFRVPEDPPTLPAAPGGRVEAFKPSPGFLRYLKLWFWLIAVVIDVLIVAAWIALLVAVWWLALLLLPIFVVVAIVPDVIAYVAMHLRYDATWYVMSERSLRIRRGIWRIDEVTVTFENVQNVKVTQGPVQRLFDIADVVVETAGGGGGEAGRRASTAHRAIVEGVAEARSIRDRILLRLRESRTAGLGDEEDEGPGSSRWNPSHLALLREIRDAAYAMGGGSR